MAIIALEGIRFHGYHGVHAPEKHLGNTFVVDVFIELDTKAAASADDLQQTINYEHIYHICRLKVEEKRHQLIETVAQNIVSAVLEQYQNIQQLRVKIRKMHPYLGGRVDCASVEMHENYMKLCSKCKRPTICYARAVCWCRDVTVHQATREALEKQYEGCLCKKCLSEYAN